MVTRLSFVSITRAQVMCMYEKSRHDVSSVINRVAGGENLSENTYDGRVLFGGGSFCKEWRAVLSYMRRYATDQTSRRPPVVFRLCAHLDDDATGTAGGTTKMKAPGGMNRQPGDGRGALTEVKRLPSLVSAVVKELPAASPSNVGGERRDSMAMARMSTTGRSERRNDEHPMGRCR